MKNVTEPCIIYIYIISAKLEGPRATVWFTYCRLKFLIFHLQIGSNQCCESKYVHWIWIRIWVPIWGPIRAYCHNYIINFGEKNKNLFFVSANVLFKKHLFTELYKNNGTWRKFWMNMVNFCPLVQPFPHIFQCVGPGPYSECGYRSKMLRLTDPFGSVSSNTGFAKLSWYCQSET